MLKILSAVLVAVLVAACASPLSGEYAKGKTKTLVISQGVWSGYQEYMTKIAGTNPGAFVVAAVDGVGVSYSYYYCPGTSCLAGKDMANSAMDRCKGMGAGVECVLFAQRNEIVVNYKRQGGEGA